MQCSRCRTKEATKEFADEISVTHVCDDCYDILDYEEWSRSVDCIFGNRDALRRQMKRGGVLLSAVCALLVVILLAGYLLGG